MIGFRSSVISGYGAKLQESISFQGSLPVEAGRYRTCISEVAIALDVWDCTAEVGAQLATSAVCDSAGLAATFPRYFGRDIFLRERGTPSYLDISIFGFAVLCPVDAAYMPRR
jgi:hypothetical protein